MSVITFSTNELSQLASNIYREYSEFFDTYQDRQIAKSEALNQYEDRDELEIRLDNFRWFFERIALANKLESLQNYSKYGTGSTITHEQIDVLAKITPMTKTEIYKKLRSIRYNASTFLNPRDTERLDNLIDIVGSDLIK